MLRALGALAGRGARPLGAMALSTEPAGVARAAAVVHERDRRMRERYDAIPDSFAPHTVPAGETVDREAVRRKRLIYRSKQRGWLEVDLILGSWAVKHVPSLTEDEVADYERLLQAETVDLFHYISGMKEPPEEMKSDVLRRIQEYAASAPIGHADAQKYEAFKSMMSN